MRRPANHRHQHRLAMCRPEVYDGGWISGGHAVAVIAECVLVAIPEWFVEPRDDFRQAAHADATNRRLLGAEKRRVEGDRAILEDAERERDDSGVCVEVAVVRCDPHCRAVPAVVVDAPHDVIQPNFVGSELLSVRTAEQQAILSAGVATVAADDQRLDIQPSRQRVERLGGAEAGDARADHDNPLRSRYRLRAVRVRQSANTFTSASAVGKLSRAGAR